MHVVSTIAECRSHRANLVSPVVFVPTMGALHAGHVKLIESAGRHGKTIVVSIFVNPTQFGPREDFTKYPRPLANDLKLCEQAGAAMVFTPTADEIYPPEAPAISINLPGLTEVLEGKHRPGHFDGVCRIVAKLFNIVRPDVALFGQKDFQQLRILRAMGEALDFPVTIVSQPTVRDADGLAMSSRNQYLSADERARALSISRALMFARAEFQAGIVQSNRLVATMRNVLMDAGPRGHVPLSIDYAVAVDPITLKNIDHITLPTVLAIAARVGNTRLIDNITIGEA